MKALLVALILCAVPFAAAAAQGDERFPGWHNRMTGYVEAKEPRWAVASWYDCRVPGQCSRSKRTASGVRFNPSGLTFAHKRMKFGARVRFHRGHRSVVCTCTDRGPFIRGREFDLSAGCARAIGMHGVSRVRAERV